MAQKSTYTEPCPELDETICDLFPELKNFPKEGGYSRRLAIASFFHFFMIYLHNKSRLGIQRDLRFCHLLTCLSSVNYFPSDFQCHGDKDVCAACCRMRNMLIFGEINWDTSAQQQRLASAISEIIWEMRLNAFHK